MRLGIYGGTDGSEDTARLKSHQQWTQESPSAVVVGGVCCAFLSSDLFSTLFLRYELPGCDVPPKLWSALPPCSGVQGDILQPVRHAADFCCWRIWALFSLSLSLSHTHTHTNLCVKLKTTKLTMGREVIYVFGFFFLHFWKKIQKTQNDKKNKSLSLSWSRSNDVTKSESARELFLDFLKALSTSPDFCSGRPSPAFFTPRKHTSFNFGVSFEWSNSSLRLVIRLRSRVMTRNY